MEEAFFAALLDSGVFRAAPASSDLLVASGPLGFVLRQLPVTVNGKRYRIDFALIGSDGAPWLACEVDGFAYHSSKDQIQYDLQRERALTAAGWTVLRFAGGEVHRDAAACVAEAVALLESRRKAG
jgi:very-short-patch-repair endonuclease